MTRSRKILALIGAVLVLALAGCVRFQADLAVSAENTLDGNIVVAVITNDDDPSSPEDAKDAAADIEDQLLPALRGSDGVTADPYEQDDYVGTRFTLDDTPIDALSGGGSEGALSLTRTGDEFEFSGTLDFTPSDDEVPAEADPGDGGIRVAISFPGEVLELRRVRAAGARAAERAAETSRIDAPQSPQIPSRAPSVPSAAISSTDRDGHRLGDRQRGGADLDEPLPCRGVLGIAGSSASSARTPAQVSDSALASFARSSASIRA